MTKRWKRTATPFLKAVSQEQIKQKRFLSGLHYKSWEVIQNETLVAVVLKSCNQIITSSFKTILVKRNISILLG